MVLCFMCLNYQKLTLNENTHYWQPIKTICWWSSNWCEIIFETQTHIYELITHFFLWHMVLKRLFNGEHLLATSFIDDYVNRLVEDGQVVATGASGEEDWSLLGVWSGRVGSADGHLCANCSLVGLYMVSWRNDYFSLLFKCSFNCFLILCEWLHGK